MIHARTAEAPPERRLRASLLSAFRAIADSHIAVGFWGQLCRILSACLTRQRCSVGNDPLTTGLVMTGLMTLELTTPNAWYNVRLAKSIGEFPGSVKWPYCGAKPLGIGGVSR